MRRRGATLAEMLVVIFLVMIVLNLLSFAFIRLYGTHRRLTLALGDLEVAERLVREVKADLRRARAVQVDSGLLTISLQDGAQVLYRAAAGEGTVHRTGEGPERQYRDAFEQVAFRPGGEGAVVLDLELRKQDRESAYHARWRSIVGWPNGAR